VQAVHDLERHGEPAPDPKHAVSLWFAPAFARRLQAAQIGTVGALAAFCNDYGASFWRRIPRIGSKAGAQILAWCRRHEQALGVALGVHVTGERLPVPAAAAAIEIHPGIARVPPLEVVTVPAYCSGSQAPNRAAPQQAAIGARTDLEAIQTYLSLRPAGSHTWRAQRKEVERFFAWAVIERGKPLSALKTEDCIAYRDFLRNPAPAERWCGKMVSRALPGWRPFQGPLSPSSRKHALTILRHFCEWLVRKQYWRVNPWLDVPADATIEPRIQTEKALSVEAWERFSGWLQQQAQAPDARQLRAAAATVILLRDTGMRLVEASRAERGAALPFGDNPQVWGELRILGKRNRMREVTLSHAAVAMLRAHWQDRGEDFDAGGAGPLLAPLAVPTTPRAQRKAARGERGYTTGGLHKLVAMAAARFAEAIGDEDPAMAAEIAGTRAHALRHTFGVHAAESEVPVDVLQQLLGHASLATTTIYTQPGRKRRIREIGKLYAAKKGG
jgi:site-specific recombinase XerD